jgi:hypothetical protein
LDVLKSSESSTPHKLDVHNRPNLIEDPIIHFKIGDTNKFLIYYEGGVDASNDYTNINQSNNGVGVWVQTGTCPQSSNICF